MRWVYAISFSLMSLSIGAQDAPTVKNDPLSNFFKNKTQIEKPFELRDPFKVPATKQDEASTKKQGYYINEKGLYSNITEESVKSIQDIKVVGVLIGKERRAMIKGQKGVIVMKEGSKIGDEGAELKAILPGGVILVEKIINVYGQEEYLETVIPISK